MTQCESITRRLLFDESGPTAPRLRENQKLAKNQFMVKRSCLPSVVGGSLNLLMFRCASLFASAVRSVCAGLPLPLSMAGDLNSDVSPGHCKKLFPVGCRR